MSPKDYFDLDPMDEEYYDFEEEERLSRLSNRISPERRKKIAEEKKAKNLLIRKNKMIKSYF